MSDIDDLEKIADDCDFRVARTSTRGPKRGHGSYNHVKGHRSFSSQLRRLSTIANKSAEKKLKSDH